MSFFNPEVPLKENVISHHPWERYIKDIYSATHKYGHNSAKNPVYPHKKDRQPDTKRVRFTIIGNRVIKEFILSVNLVKGLHKYRWKSFESPVIRGVTSVEWPRVWHDLKLQYGGKAYCLNSQLAVLINDKFLGGFSELKELIESRYVYHLTFDYYKEGVNQFSSFIRSSGRPCAYMHIAINSEHIGTFIFMLYSDVVPLTCENFLRLCKTKKGGYSGTPVHRIVKNCWIQCGGFGLKDTSLDCENFIVPHDQRGVLCMANDGRHVNCSTQFFVLLQPAPWMAHKYVAFGQLIDGEETLKKIESSPTWYESPSSPITIFDAGIFNMECHGITINKETNAYIQGHIEDLVALGELLYEALLDNVFLELEVRSVERLHGQGEVDEEAVGEEGTKDMHATKRFIRKKEDIEQQLDKSEKEVRGASPVSQSENKEFDVDVYEYEPEEYQYQHVTTAASASIVVKPEKPFYLPLTDVPYPGEIDSTYDLKKFLRGDYCLESDVDKKLTKKGIPKETVPQETFNIDTDEEEEEESEEDSDSDDDDDIKKFLKINVDRLSFAGDVIRQIARKSEKFDLFKDSRKFELITDDELRKLRLASSGYRNHRDKKVCLQAPTRVPSQKIKRRQTGFVHATDFDTIRKFTSGIDEDDGDGDDDDDGGDDRKVRIADSALETSTAQKAARRPTAFPRPQSFPAKDQAMRPSVLVRLYDEVTYDNESGPTLKDYKPVSEMQTRNNLFLTASPHNLMGTEIQRELRRHSIRMDDDSLQNLTSIQHGKKMARKISSDFVKTFDPVEHKLETSIRSVEYAKSRPAISVSEYQMKNQKYKDQVKAASKMETGSEIGGVKSIGSPDISESGVKALQHPEYEGGSK